LDLLGVEIGKQLVVYELESLVVEVSFVLKTERWGIVVSSGEKSEGHLHGEIVLVLPK